MQNGNVARLTRRLTRALSIVNHSFQPDIRSGTVLEFEWTNPNRTAPPMTTLSRLALAANARIGPHYGALVRGVSAYGAAELAIRVVRLGTTAVIARRPAGPARH